MDCTTELEISPKKLVPRLGRRAAQSISQEDSKSDDDLLDSPLSLSSGGSVQSQAPVAPPRTRKTGWGDDLKSSKSRGPSSFIEQERSRAVEKQEQNDDIPVIPDLDEIQEDDLLTEITNSLISSRISTNRVIAYKELDTDLVKDAAFTSVDGVNLSTLAEKLYHEDSVKELDAPWDWNVLFTEVVSEMYSEEQEID